MSQITTHVLDTSSGRPAEGIPITLQQSTGKDQWKEITNAVTGSDGRMATLLPPGQALPPGVYRMVFETKTYFDRRKIKAFYPFVQVAFEIADSSHYHLPLLLSPFGYSTYRGS